MQIGILGSGVTAQTLGSKLVHLGHEVMLGSREEAKPSSVAWARDAGQHALYGTFMNAASFGEVLFNCTLGMASLDALHAARAERQASTRFRTLRRLLGREDEPPPQTE